ncbi:MAG: AMP-binding protein [Actinomycetota bacterium]
MTALLGKHAAAKGDHPALIDERGTTSWAEAESRINRLIHGLRSMGLAAGDTISVVSGNRREWYEVAGAVSHAGIRYVPVNWHWSAAELAYVLENSDSRAMIVEDQFLDLAREALARDDAPDLGGRVVVIGEPDDLGTAYEELLAAHPDDEPDDQGLGGPMFYTSGTTGRPKGVASGGPLGGGNADPAILELIGAGLTGTLDVPADGTTLIVGPVYHSAQWAWSFLPFIAGSTIVSRHRFDPAEMLRLIDEHAVTNIHLVPTQFVRLLRLDDATRTAFDGSSLECVWHGAAPCSPDVKRRMLDWWGPVVHEYYGSTEGSVVTAIRGDEWPDHPTSVGRSLGMVEIHILDDDGGDVETGESGTIWMKNLMGTEFEYHKDKEKTEANRRDGGLFTTGDVGFLDGEGYLHLSDRKIDMIISGGVNIYPAEIEGVLVTHPAVADAAVFGIPNEEFGEEVKGAVKLLDGHEPSDELADAIRDHVRGELAGYKVPRSIDFEDDFPRTETGKLYKRLLRDRYWQEAGRSI